MGPSPKNQVKDGDFCEVVNGRHAGKSGTISDINMSKSGHVSISVEQKDGVRFKTLAKDVVVKDKAVT